MGKDCIWRSLCCIGVKFDYMSEEKLASFTDELAKYAQHTAAMGGTLWDFSVYGKRESMEKTAPVVEDLLGNAQL